MIYSLRVFLVHPGVKMVNYQRTVMEAWQKMLEKEGGGGERGLFCCGLASCSVLKPLLVATPPYMSTCF